jgi:hypothetical protein
MDRKQVHDEPSEVSSDAGNVTVDGPDGVDVALTPEAAEETSDRLWAEAMKARAQQRQENSGEKQEDGGGLS